MNDLRWAWRSLARSKGFVAIAVLSLALALGLNTTVYTVLDAFINPYMPFRDPDRLVRYAITGNWYADHAISRNDRYLLLRERARFTDTTAIYTLDRQVVHAGNNGETVSIADVSRNFFQVLDLAPAQGRIFPLDGDDHAVILSHGLWRRLFGGSELDGKQTVAIGGRPHAVIGVMHRDMRFPETADVWRAMPPDALARGVPDKSPQIVSRLNERVATRDAQIEVTQLAQELQKIRFPKREISFYPFFQTLEQDPYTLAPSHWALAACAFIVLLIACANLANLMLARGVARRGELALRLAIGASRHDLVRQLTAEALILAAAGGALGAAWAAWGVSLAIGKLPAVQTFITLRPMHLGWHTVAFASLASGLTTVLIGLLPAIRASDLSVADPLKDSSGTTTARRSERYSLLAVTQVALALTLLMSSAILVRSTSQIATEESDLNQPDIHGVWVSYPSPFRVDRPTGRTDTTALTHILEKVRAVAGVEVATSWAGVGFRSATRLGAHMMGDWEGGADNPLVVTGLREVSTDYFQVFRRQIVAGRQFEAGAGDEMIISQTTARGLWPQGNPLGHSVRVDNGPWIPVVGVVEDFRYGKGAYRAAIPELYYRRARSPIQGGNISFREDGTNPRVMLDVALEVQAAALLPVPPPVTDQGAGVRFNANIRGFIATLFVFLAICGLGLASLGLYGVLAYTVGRRMREFGIRVALGATSRDVFRLVMHDGTVMFLAGTAIGAFVAMFMGQFVNALLYKVGFTDVLSLVVCETILCAVAFLACLVPARRAMSSDPMEILRAT